MNMLEKFIAVLVGPGAMCRMSHKEAEDIAKEIMALVNEQIADSPAYKQWAKRGFPK